MFTMSAGEPPKFIAAVREMDRVDRRPAAAARSVAPGSMPRDALPPAVEVA